MQMCMDHADIFSTCGKKQYSAILVDKHGHVVGIGYNGGPRGFNHCEDGGCPRFLNNSPSGSDYDDCIAIHAEQNAFLHSDYSANPKKIYVNGPPCFTCAKLIANSTVKTVYYLYDESYSNWKKVKKFLNKAGVKTVMVGADGSW
jgi:dCMP deaminase